VGQDGWLLQCYHAGALGHGKVAGQHTPNSQCLSLRQTRNLLRDLNISQHFTFTAPSTRNSKRTPMIDLDVHPRSVGVGREHRAQHERDEDCQGRRWRQFQGTALQHALPRVMAIHRAHSSTPGAQGILRLVLLDNDSLDFNDHLISAESSRGILSCVNFPLRTFLFLIVSLYSKTSAVKAEQSRLCDANGT